MIVPRDRPQRITADELPNELLLQIFPHLTLRSLIAARGVDKRWRSLVRQAYITPPRKRLLELFLNVLDIPACVESRLDIIQHIIPFDRHAYMQLLPSNPPDEFETWVREWPAYGVIGWVWPGLQDIGQCRRWKFSCRCNCLGHWPPFVKNITFHERVKSDASGSVLPTDSSDVIYHAAAYLPVDANVNLGGGISWLDEEESEMVSIEMTVLCVCTCTDDGRRFWLILDGKRGGEKLKGWVYLGGAGLDLKPDDIVAKSWTDFLALNLEYVELSEEVANDVSHAEHYHAAHSPKVRVTVAFYPLWGLV